MQPQERFFLVYLVILLQWLVWVYSLFNSTKKRFPPKRAKEKKKKEVKLIF